MIVSSESADFSTSSAYSRCSVLSSVSRSSSVMPMTPFIGVRISWLMLARNSLLAWLALFGGLLGAMHFLLGLLARRDVDQGPFDDRRHARLALEQRHAFEHPHRRAILAPVAALDIGEALLAG